MMDGVGLPTSPLSLEGHGTAPAAQEVFAVGHDEHHAPNLESMPVEIAHSISSYLTTKDLGALRLTSSKVEQKLRRNFTQEFFTKKQFMLTEFSLQALIDISRHSLFASELQHLIIGLDHSSYNQLHPESQFVLASKALKEDQLMLLQTGRAVAMLAEALRNLPNLQVIDIRDFNSRSRTRDPPPHMWESYGAPTIRRMAGPIIGTHSSGRMDTFVDSVFVAVLTALAQAEARPRSLEILLRDKQWAISDLVLAISSWMLPSLGPVLENLQTLHLCHRLCIDKTDPDSPVLLSANLCKFLGHTKNLRWLRLNFQNGVIDATDLFLTWLGRDPASHQAATLHPPPVALPLLERLDLGHTTMSSSEFRAVLAKWAPTLKVLSLRHVALSAAATANKDRRNDWRDLFADLMKNPALKLCHVSVSQLWQRGRHNESRPWQVPDHAVYFAPRTTDNIHNEDDDDDANMLYGKSPVIREHELYGNSADIFRKLAREVRVVGPPAADYSDQEDEDSEEDD